MSAFRSPVIDPHLEADLASVGANLGLSGVGALDGVTPSVGYRVLAKDQTTLSQNGLWVVQSSAWTRPPDFGGAGGISQDVPAAHAVRVARGTVNGKTEWTNTDTGVLVPGTTSLHYSRSWPDYDDLYANPWDPNLIGDNVEREAATSTFTQASGTLYLYGGFVLRANVTYSGVSFFHTTTGATLTHGWAGLVAQVAVNPYSARQLIAVSVDNTGATVTANAFRSFTFGAAVTPQADTPVWIAYMISGTTVPPLAATPAAANAALLGQGVVLAGTSNTGQTTPLALNTIVTAPTAIAQLGYGFLN